MTAPRRRPIVDSLVAALLSALATAMFLLLTAVTDLPAVPQPLLLIAAAATGVCA